MTDGGISLDYRGMACLLSDMDMVYRQYTQVLQHVEKSVEVDAVGPFDQDGHPFRLFCLKGFYGGLYIRIAGEGVLRSAELTAYQYDPLCSEML